MKKIKSAAETLYPVYFCDVKNIREIAEQSIPTQQFALLVCADFQEISTDDISYAAEALLEKGIFWFCAWGTDCERAHDICDEVVCYKDVICGNDESTFVMTTWHKDEPLEEALWHVLYCTPPSDEYAADYCTIVATVNNNSWSKEILKNLSDIAAFNERLLDE